MQQRGTVRLTLILLLLICVVLFCWSRRNSAPNTVKPGLSVPRTNNRLALGPSAATDLVDITIASPATFNGAHKKTVLDWRAAQISPYAELLAAPYQPSDEVFGQIVDGAPWWGIEGVFLHGPGQRSIEGAAEESRFILNPFLLVAAEFNENRRAHVEEGASELWCQPHSLRWMPRQRRAEVTYPGRCIAQRSTRHFDLIAYNARDLGLGYMYVDYAASMNIGKIDAPRAAYANPQFIHKGGSCGYPGGCNNLSPQTPPIDDLEIRALPAKLEILLWYAAPGDVATTPPDLRYRINFE